MRGTLYMTQAVVPHMRGAGAGTIVNMSSVSAQRGGGVFGGSHYAAAKAAILGFTKAAARELGPDNIRVNALCPSFIDTDIAAGMMSPRTAAVGRRQRADGPAGPCARGGGLRAVLGVGPGELCHRQRDRHQRRQPHPLTGPEGHHAMNPKPKKKPADLRSQQWFGRQDRDGFNYRSWVKGKGVPHDQFDGRPVIGICNTFSELTPCNSHFRTLAEQVKIGVYEAGGFPLEFPVMSLGETLLRPTAMLYRNLASMDVEESIRGNPIDGVVLLMGCDKTTPSLVMGAASVDLPTIGVSPAGRCSTASGAARSSARAPACGA